MWPRVASRHVIDVTRVQKWNHFEFPICDVYWNHKKLMFSFLNVQYSIWGPKLAPFETSWGHLRSILGPPWIPLGPSWDHVVGNMSHLGNPWGALEVIENFIVCTIVHADKRKACPHQYYSSPRQQTLYRRAQSLGLAQRSICQLPPWPCLGRHYGQSHGHGWPSCLGHLVNRSLGQVIRTNNDNVSFHIWPHIQP